MGKDCADGKLLPWGIPYAEQVHSGETMTSMMVPVRRDNAHDAGWMQCGATFPVIDNDITHCDWG